MSSFAPKKKRRCSVCRETGHTKRTCTNKKTTPAPVVVRVAPEPAVSRHVVNLKKEKEKRLEQIAAFREAVAPKTTRVHIDIAELIRLNQLHEQHRARVDAAKQRTQVSPPEQKAPLSPVAPVPPAPPPAQTRKQPPRMAILRQRIAHTVHAFQGSLLSLNKRAIALRAVAVLLIVALPFPAVGYYNRIQHMSEQVVTASAAGFLSLQSATVAALGANTAQAQMDLSLALSAFSEAQSLIDQEHRALQYVAGLLPVVGTHVKSRQELLVAGHHLALGNTYLVKGIDTASNRKDLKTTDRFTVLTHHVRGAIPQYKEALTALTRIDPDALPEEYRTPFAEFKLLFAAFIDDLEDVVQLGDALNRVFGGDGFKRYLIVFQNNRELRPTGGFLGSAAIVDVQKGEIQHIEVPGGGLYDWQGQLDTHVRPPLPLQLVNQEWEAHDANWWPDFETSAQKLQWFYEHSRGATVDGVIAVNADVFTDVLHVLGPITSDNFELTFDAETGLETLQKQVEVEYDKEENKPKAVIGDLTTELLTQEYDSLDVVRLLGVWHRGLETKDIQIQMNDPALQQLFADFGWTGEVAETAPDQDYLLVVNTNLQGQKSDAKITQHVDHQVTVNEDGSAVGTVVITREHTGAPGEQFYGATNLNYVRVYVPEGAVLLEAGGFQFPPEEAFKVPAKWTTEDPDVAAIESPEEIHPQSGTQVSTSFGKTVFGNWMITGPGETTKAYVVYQLPFSLLPTPDAPDSLNKKIIEKLSTPATTYSILIQKQSGINSTVDSQVIYPDTWKPVWRSSDAVELATNGARFSGVLDRDTHFGVAFEQRSK